MMQTVFKTRTIGSIFLVFTVMIGVEILGGTIGTACAAADDASKPIAIGDRNQVFIDGRFLATQRNVRIAVCPPRKTYEQCLTGLHPYDTILPVDGTFRGFHALSKDGAHWRRVEPGTRPEQDDVVGLYEGQPHPFVDPIAPPNQRYKLFDPLAGWIKASVDGSHWETVAEHMLPAEATYPQGMDSLNKCFYDQRLGKYVAYVRVNKGYPAPADRREYFGPLSKERFGRDDLFLMRAIGRSVTDDLKRFPMPEVVFEWDEKDPQFGGVSVLDYYTPEVIQYPYAQDAYFLFSARFLHYEDWYLADDLTDPGYSRHVPGPKGQLNVGALDIGFAASRDGIHWNRFDRVPWIPLGPEKSFDSKSMYLCSGMVSNHDEIWMYYIGYPVLHGGLEPPDKAVSTLSRVVMLKDRFTGIETNYAGGEFTTPPMVFDGRELHVNIETSAVGLARFEIQDGSGKPIEGYALADCDRIHTANSTDRAVTWRHGKADVSSLAGKPVRLRVELQFGAKLYAFRFFKGQ